MSKKKRTIENATPLDNDVNEYNSMKLMIMTAMSEMGISAEEYDAFLKSGIDKAKIRDMMLDMHLQHGGNGFDEDDDEDDDNDLREFLRPRPISDSVVPMPEAENKSLRIKVQMKDVSKPPMWRELVIPADFNFSQLHYAIQAATGLSDCHLWQFQHQAYNPDLQIGIPTDGDFSFGLDEWTHDADTTPVSGFLSKKGDKLEYVYDFGDDWIFTVSVLEVMDRTGEVAECVKWKCDFQPIDDCGGVYSYLRLRDIAAAPDSLDKKAKKEIAQSYDFENFNQFAAWLDEATIDIEYVNEQLADIPDEYQRPD
ncbi:MAG: plasmid pRiA4b ORF-3 family protein [Muribaculaceae bacterium]|nr:plasmid pRiA4b ORF-3 family protein [Muribaculaceae bacterium]